jgi:hypothetical protein
MHTLDTAFPPLSLSHLTRLAIQEETRSLSEFGVCDACACGSRHSRCDEGKIIMRSVWYSWYSSPLCTQSDHPVVNSRYLLNEAALAYFYGLNPGLALASVTSRPADALGLGHRVGTICKGVAHNDSMKPFL